MTDFNTTLANAAAAEKAGFAFMRSGTDGGDNRADEQFERASQLRKLARRQFDAACAARGAAQEHHDMLANARRLLVNGEPLSPVAAQFGYTPSELMEALRDADL